MIDVLNAEINVTSTRIGVVDVKYYELVICAEICLYKEEKLWIRMPEYWKTKEIKRRMAYWGKKDVSDQMQVLILNKVFDIIQLDLEKAISLKRAFFGKRKELTKQKNKLTLNEKTPTHKASAFKICSDHKKWCRY